MNESISDLNVEQISNYVFCDAKLNSMDIETKIIPNNYYDYPYLLIENFLETSTCNKINSYIKMKNEFTQANLRVKKKSYRIEKKLNKKIRNTNIYKLDRRVEKKYYGRFKEFQAQIERFFSLGITLSTDIQALEYKEGFFYKAHSDDSSMIYENDQLIGFLPIAKQRKITTVLFTSSYEKDFCGGELVFNFLYDSSLNNISIKPRKGDMLVFLSNPYFTHEVLPVTKGTRITLVQWHNAI